MSKKHVRPTGAQPMSTSPETPTTDTPQVTEQTQESGVQGGEDQAVEQAQQLEQERAELEAAVANAQEVAANFQSEAPVVAVQTAPAQTEAERQVDTMMQTYLTEMHPAKMQTPASVAQHQRNLFAFLVYVFTNYEGEELRKAFFKLKNYFTENRKDPEAPTALSDQYMLRDVDAAFADRNYQAGMNLVTLLINASSQDMSSFVKGTTLNIRKMFETPPLNTEAAERFITMLAPYK